MPVGIFLFLVRPAVAMLAGILLPAQVSTLGVLPSGVGSGVSLGREPDPVTHPSSGHCSVALQQVCRAPQPPTCLSRAHAGALTRQGSPPPSR